MQTPSAFQRFTLPHAEMAAAHQPVLYHEIIHALRPESGGLYLDGTIGAGGHARGILEACSPAGRLIGLDIDPQALALARECLAPYGQRVRLIQASYVLLGNILRENGMSLLDGILLDLGVSSMQLDTPERGFSWMAEGPLDMRFDPSMKVRAADLVNDLHEMELADLIFRYGEEPEARRIARAIVRSRPLDSTGKLATVIRSAASRGRSLQPVVRTFQALRIAVNEELAAISEVLPEAVNALRAGGRLAVISFHSLEDRIVKEFFRKESRDCLCPPRQPVCTCGHRASLLEITHRPIVPAEAEIQSNRRARSARLRVAEKVRRNDGVG